MAISSEKKAVIHVAKAQLHMAEEDYRALLRQAGGVDSASDLDEASFTAVMAVFERLGFRSAKGRAQQTRRAGMATAAQIGRIRGLWKAYTDDESEARLGRWLERHFHVSHVRFLEDWRAGKAIAILIKMQAHPNAKHQRRSKPDEAQSA